jgi:CubicO group peptidase (beta-lactamase class C family)
VLVLFTLLAAALLHLEEKGDLKLSHKLSQMLKPKKQNSETEEYLLIK